MSGNKFYAVHRGRVPGVYFDWASCKAQVDGFAGNSYKSFSSLSEAQKFVGGSNPSLGAHLAPASSSSSGRSLMPLGPLPSIPQLPIESRSPFQSPRVPISGLDLLQQSNQTALSVLGAQKLDPSRIYVDGGHNRQTGDEAWACVVDSLGQDLVEVHQKQFLDLQLRDVQLPVGRRFVAVSKFKDVVSQQNNGAELLAMVMALRIAENNPGIATVCSDSHLIVEFWSRKLGHSQRLSMDPRKVQYIDELIYRASKFRLRGGQLVQIPGKGNPADLGYH